MPQNQNQEKIKCQTRNEIYIGKTERILAHRINEHNSKNKNIESAIQSHKKENPTHNKFKKYNLHDRQSIPLKQ